jgi:hypothetical protein
MHPFTAIETYGSGCATDDEVAKVMRHPNFKPTVPGWEWYYADQDLKDLHERSFYLTVKLETKTPYFHSEEKDLVRKPTDGRVNPDFTWAQEVMELRAEALLRPFTLKTWMEQVEPGARPIMVRLGILVITDLDELYETTGIDLSPPCRLRGRPWPHVCWNRGCGFPLQACIEAEVRWRE